MAMVGGERSSKGTNISRPFAWSKNELEGLSLSTSLGGGLVIVAADVIYDEGLTDAFFDVLKLLMPPRKKREETIADDCSCDGKSAPKSAGSGGVAEQTPPANSASSVDSAVFDVPASSTGNKPTIEEQGRSGVRGAKGDAVLYLALEKRFNFSMAELSVAATGYSALLRNVLDTTTEGDNRGAGVVQGCAQQGLNAQKSFEGKRLPLPFQQCFRYQRSNAMELWEIRRRPV